MKFPLRLSGHMLSGVALHAAESATPNTSAERVGGFDDARFGMFVHWGVSAVPAGEGKGKHISGAPDPEVSIIRMDFAGPATVYQKGFNVPDKNGRIELSAHDADANGSYDGNVQLKKSGEDAFLSDWTNPKWNLEFHVKTPQAVRWTATAPTNHYDDSYLLRCL